MSAAEARILAANLRRGAFVDDNGDEVADILDALASEVEALRALLAAERAGR